MAMTLPYCDQYMRRYRDELRSGMIEFYADQFLTTRRGGNNMTLAVVTCIVFCRRTAPFGCLFTIASRVVRV